MRKRESTEEAWRRRQELLARLAATHPYMFRPVKGRDDFFRFNPEIGDGWLDIFEELCGSIDRTLTPTQKKRFRLVAGEREVRWPTRLLANGI